MASTYQEQYRLLLPRLFALYPSLPSLRLKDSYRGVPHLAHGWYMRCHRGVEAVLRLEDGGYQVEAAPIRRSVIEHIIALRWLAKEATVVERVIRRGTANDAARRKEAIEQAGWTSVDLALFDAAMRDGEGLDASNDNQRTFRERFERVGDPHTWVEYLAETGQCHPCWESAAPYLETSDGTVFMRTEPVDQVDQAGFCALHLYEAVSAVNHIARGKPLNVRLKEIERDLATIVVRQRTDQGLPVPEELRQAARGQKSH